jgi:Ca2+-binding EF-hand superfamily protein
MSLMAWSLTNAQHAQDRDHFLALDKDHDGAISLEELKEALGRTDADETEIHRVFDLLSQGHEDKIHYSDFLAAMVSTHLEVDDHLVQVAFTKFDRRGTGLVGCQDLKTILGSSFDGSEIVALIGEADQDNDLKIDLEEFRKYIRSSRTQLLNQPHFPPSKSSLAPTNSEGSKESVRTPTRNPVLLGNQHSLFAANAGAQKGLQQEPPFAVNLGSPKVQVVEVCSKTPPPACCIVQ